MKVTVKTKGFAPQLAKEVEVEARNIADELQSVISGGKANESQVIIVTQEFIDRYNFVAKYKSGTFLGFSYDEEALDEIEEAR